MSQIKLPPYQRKKSVSSIQSQNLIICSPNLPAGYIPLDNQVAGHIFKNGTNEIGKYHKSYIKQKILIEQILHYRYFKGSGRWYNYL